MSGFLLNPFINKIVTSAGSASFTTAGTFSWTCPPGVNFVSAVCVGGGGGANLFYRGGGGGGVAWKNDIAVTPGNSYTVVVGAGGTYSVTQTTQAGSGGTSYFINTSTVAASGGAGGLGIANAQKFTTNNPSVGGSVLAGSGSTGGTGYLGGGGAAGYTNLGGDGSSAATTNPGGDGAGGGGGGGAVLNSSPWRTAGGGGVGINGRSSSGLGGTYLSGNVGSTGKGGSGGANAGKNAAPTTQTEVQLGGKYGGGAGVADTAANMALAPANGGVGAVRIVWGAGGGNSASTGISFPDNAA